MVQSKNSRKDRELNRRRQISWNEAGLSSFWVSFFPRPVQHAEKICKTFFQYYKGSCEVFFCSFHAFYLQRSLRVGPCPFADSSLLLCGLFATLAEQLAVFAITTSNLQFFLHFLPLLRATLSFSAVFLASAPAALAVVPQFCPTFTSNLQLWPSFIAAFGPWAASSFRICSCLTLDHMWYIFMSWKSLDDTKKPRLWQFLCLLPFLGPSFLPYSAR